jgi:hypothetical protein
VRRRLDAPLIRRHPGKEGRDDEHGADGHEDDDDKRAHEGPATVGDRFSTMTSDEFVAALDQRAGPVKNKVRDLPSSELPRDLQGLIAYLQSKVTRLEATLANPKHTPAQVAALRIGISGAARSWHDDSGKKLPAPAGGTSPRAAFFADWRARMAAEGREVPAKQAGKAGVERSEIPYREITCVGWAEAAQNGRLIYDPVDDLFYLTCQHYRDAAYFRVLAPPRAAAASATAEPATAEVSPFEVELLLQEAWATVAAEVDEEIWGRLGGGSEAAMATAAPTAEKGRGSKSKRRAPGGKGSASAAVATAKEEPSDDEEAPPARERPLEAMDDDTARCATELFQLRAQYAAAVATAKDMERRAASGASGGKRSEAFAPLPWRGGAFVVGSINGYIGYQHRGAVQLPGYDRGTTVGDLGGRFQGILDAGACTADEGTALMLAGLVAETVRHPPAALEALFVVIQRPVFEKSRTAYGNALPMSAGSTLGAGIIEVTRKEAGLTRDAIVRAVSLTSSAEPGQINDAITKLVSTTGSGALPALTGYLRSLLVGYEDAFPVLERATADAGAARNY